MLSLNSSGIYCAIVISLSYSLSSIGPSLFMGLLMNKSYTRLCDAFFSRLSDAFFLYWEPDILGNSDNQIIANPLVTPNNILPEWYYLLFHSCPRSFPNKTIGVILVLNLLIMIIPLKPVNLAIITFNILQYNISYTMHSFLI